MSEIVRTASTGLAALIQPGRPPYEQLLDAWLAEYRSKNTRTTYAHGVRSWFRFCELRDVDPLNALRVHVSTWVRSMEEAGAADRTISAYAGAVHVWYSYLVDEEVLDRDPTRRVKTPKIDRRQTPTGWLTRGQLLDLLEGAELVSPTALALLSTLAFNGLRISEACSLDVSSIHQEQFHSVAVFTRKGGKQGRAILSIPTQAAITAALDGREIGPLFTTRTGHRMYQTAAQRLIDKAMKAGDVRCRHRITPHSLRHTWATIALAGGASVQQVQHDGGWADPRLLDVYTHGHDAPVKAASHLVAAFTYSAA